MSFLKPDAAGGTGLGSSLGFNPGDVKAFGTAMNGIASAGGATPGYASQQAPDVNNHLQLLDPDVLKAIIAKFGPTPIGGGGTVAPGAYQ